MFTFLNKLGLTLHLQCEIQNTILKLKILINNFVT